jgi:hypothetical protein
MIPELFRGLCDDAAVFPPGNAPLPHALAQHADYRAAAYRDLVGPFVFPIPRLRDLADAVRTQTSVALTAPDGPSTVGPALALAQSVDCVNVTSVEVALPEGADLALLHDIDTGIDVYVEIPRDERCLAVLDVVADAGWRAKFRTGGVTADAYPDERELAAAIHAAVSRGVGFKATAGLHHAVRNTAPGNGFEQHGYLNVLLAGQAAAVGAKPRDLAAILAMRDPNAVAQQISGLRAPRTFLSFGTCSILEPLDDLSALGLIEPIAQGVSS